MKTGKALLLDGTPFTFWDDQTDYRHMNHVDYQHPTAADDTLGREDKPFANINQAPSHYNLIKLSPLSRTP